MTTVSRIILVLVVLLASVGCNGGGSEQASRCQSVPAQLTQAIEQGLTITGGGLLGEASAVKSNDFESVYFVAAMLRGEGMGDDAIGLWATNDLDGNGMIYAVDAIANEFSDWADGRATDAAFSVSDDGAQEAIDCLQ